MPAPPVETAHADETQRGERFAFGENWRQFLSVLDEPRIEEAERSLRESLGRADLKGAEFLDIGCGSGLFSLAAIRLGAARVHSFDFDPGSAGCAAELKRRFFPAAEHWTIETGSALDEDYVRSLGTFDIVYSWGVLHHTGDMWRALANAALPVAPGGRLFISIYNDEGLQSRVWRRVKRLYNELPPPLRKPYAVAIMLPRELLYLAVATVRGEPGEYLRSWTRYRRERGMSRWHDIIDWVGGYPFEVATPDEVFDFYRERGFRLDRLVTSRGLGCNEFVFSRE